MILRNWELDFEFDDDMLSQILIWVKFPRLHVLLICYKVEKISYARVLIEVDISKNLCDVIAIETPTGPQNQYIKYEWRPKFCNHCLRLGHKDVEYWYNHPSKEYMVESYDEGERNQMGATMGYGKRRKNKGKRSLVSKWIHVKAQSPTEPETRIDTSKLTLEPSSQPPPELDPRQRLGKQYVDESSHLQII
ncbi:hypothetical protein H5410_045641 [Solanum commersonii]|uniref:DUF4283 domain-containing protein n=1 Tax=Solanum commersonii TaxID=4109 RepID=A0A9J5XC81_SOLCO|nr:hypothetical protein H5410_045641 [Solanum commersonii]